MNRLTQIANDCKTDKGTIKGECHGYTEIYEDYLKNYDNPKILEIGSWYGASTKMFNDFYDGNCEIWTYDIDYTKYSYKFNQDNIHCFKGDQNKERDWNTFFENAPENFDIIIDDGSHMPEHQIHTLYWLQHNLNENGIYILEDLHTFSWDKLHNSPICVLNFWQPSEYITGQQLDELKNNIKLITTYNINNPKNQYGGFSITSIIKFK